jgi:hypothetical protein
MNTPEKDAVLRWLSQKAGVPAAVSETLAPEIIDALISNPREGLAQIFQQLDRKLPPEAKLKVRVQEVQKIVGDIRSGVTRTVATPTRKPIERSTEEDEAHLDQLIGNVEDSFFEFEDILRERMSHMELPSYLDVENLFAPFEAMRINRDNSRKNMIRGERRMKDQKTTSVFIALKHPYEFFYKFLKPDPNQPHMSDCAAGFSPVERVMHLPVDHDPHSIIDTLILYHELRHANQDASLRVNMMHNPQAQDMYQAFYTGKRGQKPRIVVTEEATAYGYEMEVLNILLKGKLQAGNMTIDDVANELDLTHAERPQMETLLRIASHYYPEGTEGGNFSIRFIDFIRDTHIDMGFDVYIQTTKGLLRQMTKGD